MSCAGDEIVPAGRKFQNRDIGGRAHGKGLLHQFFRVAVKPIQFLCHIRLIGLARKVLRVSKRFTPAMAEENVSAGASTGLAPAESERFTGIKSTHNCANVESPSERDPLRGVNEMTS